MKSIVLMVGMTMMAAPDVAIRVSPSGLFAGQTITITCVIQPHPDNRILRIGLVNASDSEVSIDFRKTYTRQVKHVPCEAQAAYCQLIQADGKVKEVATRITVLGCDREL